MSLVLGQPAPPWQVEQWLNCSAPLSLAALRGRVVVVHAFQMLCPGCVQHGLPQALRVQALFDPAEVVVIGLHTVFEHHAAMPPHALAAFAHEYRLNFPLGIDQDGGEDPLPLTMRAWGLRGTPSLVLIDRSGSVRMHEFGALSDLRLGAAIADALRAGSARTAAPATPATLAGDCDAEGCRIA